MSILDQLLGGSDSESVSTNSNDSSLDLGTVPALGFQASDILHSSNADSDDGGTDSSDFTGIGDIGLGISAPTVVGVSSSSDSASVDQQDGNDGGLLSGLF